MRGGEVGARARGGVGGGGRGGKSRGRRSCAHGCTVQKAVPVTSFSSSGRSAARTPSGSIWPSSKSSGVAPGMLRSISMCASRWPAMPSLTTWGALNAHASLPAGGASAWRAQAEERGEGRGTGRGKGCGTERGKGWRGGGGARRARVAAGLGVEGGAARGAPTRAATEARRLVLVGLAGVVRRESAQGRPPPRAGREPRLVPARQGRAPVRERMRARVRGDRSGSVHTRRGCRAETTPAPRPCRTVRA